MLITILEGRVTSERWHKLSEIYGKGIKKLPMSLFQTFLIQDTHDSNIWRIISEWRSKEEYEHSSDSRDHDSSCMEMFRSIGVEPTCRIFEVRGHHEHV
jgi:hypothetical protein